MVPPEQVVEAATATADQLGQLRTGAYGRTKQVARQAAIAHILDTLEDDMGTITGPDA